jgi:hypothetical protein
MQTCSVERFERKPRVWIKETISNEMKTEIENFNFSFDLISFQAANWFLKTC